MRSPSCRATDFPGRRSAENIDRESLPSACDKASPAVAVVLHLRSCYVSKAAILTVPIRAYRSKIEVPLEFQGLGSLGAASWRRFFPCEFDSNKERAVAAEDPSVSGVSGRYATALFE